MLQFAAVYIVVLRALEEGRARARKGDQEEPARRSKARKREEERGFKGECRKRRRKTDAFAPALVMSLGAAPLLRRLRPLYSQE